MPCRWWWWTTGWTTRSRLPSSARSTERFGAEVFEKGAYMLWIILILLLVFGGGVWLLRWSRFWMGNSRGASADLLPARDVSLSLLNHLAKCSFAPAARQGSVRNDPNGRLLKATPHDARKKRADVMHIASLNSLAASSWRERFWTKSPRNRGPSICELAQDERLNSAAEHAPGQAIEDIGACGIKGGEK